MQNKEVLHPTPRCPAACVGRETACGSGLGEVELARCAHGIDLHRNDVLGQEASLQQQLGQGVFDALLNGALDRKSTRLNSSHSQQSRMPSSA